MKAGDRVFAVAVEGSQQLDALDVVLFRDGRARSALTVTLPNIEVTDGTLDVRLVPVKGQPILGALEIEPTRLLGERTCPPLYGRTTLMARSLTCLRGTSSGGTQGESMMKIRPIPIKKKT